MLSLFMITGASHAASIDGSAKIEESAKVERAIINSAQKSQNIVSDSSDHAFELRTEIEALKAEINGLEVYENHLNRLIDSQAKELESAESQLNQISSTRQSIVPLMYQMLDTLTAYVAQDMPIRKDTREERIKSLNELMVQADISDAEKFRRILEAYQIEVDYVNKLGTYTSSIEIEGVVRETEQLYLGHISFIARSLDKQHYWVWVAKQKMWVSLDTVLHNELNHAYSVAEKLATPSLLKLPLSVSKVNQ